MYHLIFKNQYVKSGDSIREFDNDIGRFAPERFYQVLNDADFDAWQTKRAAAIQAEIAQQAAQNVQPDTTGTQPA